jgi:hypothetical protein
MDVLIKDDAIPSPETARTIPSTPYDYLTVDPLSPELIWNQSRISLCDASGIKSNEICMEDRFNSTQTPKDDIYSIAKSDSLDESIDDSIVMSSSKKSEIFSSPEIDQFHKSINNLLITTSYIDSTHKSDLNFESNTPIFESARISIESPLVTIPPLSKDTYYSSETNISCESDDIDVNEYNQDHKNHCLQLLKPLAIQMKIKKTNLSKFKSSTILSLVQKKCVSNNQYSYTLKSWLQVMIINFIVINNI